MRTLFLAALLVTSALAQPQSAVIPAAPASNAIPLGAGSTIQGSATTAAAVTYSIFGLALTSSPSYGLLAQGQLGSSTAVLYTVPAQTTAFVTEMVLANTTSSAVTGVTLLLNGTAASNQILSSLTIPANGSLIFNSFSMQIHDGNGNLLQTGTPAFDATVPAPTSGTAGAVGSASTAARRDHTHQSPGGIASLATASSALSGTETLVLSATLPAGMLKAGSSIRVQATGTCTSSVANASNFRARIGTAGTSADAAVSVVTPTAAASGTNIPFAVELFGTVETAGSSGTALGGATLINNGTTGVSAADVVVGQVTSPITVNTTVVNILQLSYSSAASTTACTFYNATLEVVEM